VAEYLDAQIEDLTELHGHPVTGRIKPASVTAELVRVRRWSQQLRAAALQEISG
jgi:hypothetical protein